MKRQRVIPVLLVWFLGVSYACAQAGSAGFAMLKLGMSGRGLAMGDATGATVDNASSLLSNPAAALSFSPSEVKADLVFSHRSWIQDVKTEYLAGSVPIGRGKMLSAMVTTTTISGTEARLRPGPADNTFDSRELIAGFAFTTRLEDDLNIGVALKYMYQRIYVDDASGVACDLGLLWNSPIEGLRIGVSGMNLGRMSPLVSERTVLPSLLRVGGSFDVIAPAESFSCTVAADGIRALAEGNTYANLGGELGFQKTLFARAGYQLGSASRGLSAGVGVRYGKFHFDYAYSHLALDLGNGATFSVGLNL
jgi:hypothetical protein